VKSDFDLSGTLAQFIPAAVFLWFFLLSVSVGIFQDRYGKRFTVNLGMVITGVGLFIPYFYYTYISTLVGFALLGIGNTIVQVSANPLLVDVVPDSRRASFLSLSQFIKAIGSMIAPILAGIFAARFGDWKIVLLVYGIVSVLSVVWLGSVKIVERQPERAAATLRSSFKLLGNGYILMMVLGIGIVSENAEKARSIYFLGRMLGTLGGALLLTRLSSRHFLLWSSVLTLIAFLVLIVSPFPSAGWVIIFIIGLTVANIFPLIFSITVGKYPDRANEISGLMIMAVSGGGLIPPVMGWLSDHINITASMFVLVFCAAYLIIASIIVLKRD
jgi:FHS family L-fucose permease-like MFS transporter